MRAFLRTLSIVLLVAWMCLIFYLSSQPADVSSKTSGTVIEIVAENFYPDFENLTEAEETEVIESFQFTARKTAHVCVFAVLGTLSLLALISYRRLHMKTRAALSLLISALYAVSDEYHQKFVDGRSAELRDLLLDIGGAIAAILLTLMLVRIISPWYRRVKYQRSSSKMSVADAVGAAAMSAFESGVIDGSRNINAEQKADPIFDEIFAEPEEIKEGETVMEEPREIIEETTEEAQEIPEETIEEETQELSEEELVEQEPQEIAEELPTEEITDQAEICEEEISEEICEETEQEEIPEATEETAGQEEEITEVSEEVAEQEAEIPEELSEKEPESSYKNVKPEEIDYAASVIGKSVIEVTKVCNKITADSNGNDTKELINLALGRNEVFKSSVFGILCEGIDFEEKKQKIENERKDAFDYFASILAQIC